MKIFLNNRTIQFAPNAPEILLPTDMVAVFESPEKLQEAYMDFERYEKYLNLWILVGGKGDENIESTVKIFVSFFKIVPAAGGLVKNEKGEYLFIHRLGHWDLPKGKIDKKDILTASHGKKHSTNVIKSTGVDAQILSHARVAAVREVKEETGLKSVSIVRNLASTWHIYMVKEKRCIKQTWWFEMSADSAQILKPQTSEGIFLVKWTSSGAIHCILSHTYASIRELLLEVIF
jgi:8-oxo-dGTP pyrophosphatase MutT (NUDIX family)